MSTDQSGYGSSGRQSMAAKMGLAVALADLGVGDVQRTAVDLEVAALRLAVALRRHDRQPRVPLQVARLPGVAHHAQQQLSIDEVHLVGADPWPAVRPQGPTRQRFCSLNPSSPSCASSGADASKSLHLIGSHGNVSHPVTKAEPLTW